MDAPSRYATSYHGATRRAAPNQPASGAACHRPDRRRIHLERRSLGASDHHRRGDHLDVVRRAVPPANDPRWPASPVLVELSRVSVPRGDAAGGQAIVGVGLAGRSHFSASIAPDPHDAGVIRFEIACRLHEPPGWIGSAYRQGDRLFRLIPLDDSTTLPRTVVWAYSIGPTGMTSVSGAAVSTSPA